MSTAPSKLSSSESRCRRARQRGAVLVEYAFTFIFFMVLFLGIMGFGHALYAYHYVNNAAKEAARWAAVNGANCSYDSSCNGVAPMNNGPATAADVNTYVQNNVPAGIDATQVTTSVCGVSGGTKCAASTPTLCITTVNAPGCTVQVTINYNFNFIFPLLPSGTIAMSSQSDMIIVH